MKIINRFQTDQMKLIFCLFLKNRCGQYVLNFTPILLCVAITTLTVLGVLVWRLVV